MSPKAPSLRRAYADGPGGQVHYYDSGGDGPALLLLHQSPSSSSDYFTLAPYLLAAGLRVIAMDTPGLGLSDAPPQVPTIQDYALAVPAVLDAAGVKDAHLFGYHTGVSIAVEAAVSFPGRVRSLSLLGVTLLSAQELKTLWEQLVPYEQENRIHKPETGGANLMEYLARVDGLFGPVAAQRILLSALNAGPSWWQGHNAALRHDLTPSFMAVHQPMLLISHPNEMLLEHTRAAAKLRHDAQLAILEIDREMAMDSDPERLAAAITAFIQRCP